MPHTGKRENLTDAEIQLPAKKGHLDKKATAEKTVCEKQKTDQVALRLIKKEPAHTYNNETNVKPNVDVVEPLDVKPNTAKKGAET